MVCIVCNAREAEAGRDECFRCRVMSIGFTFRGSAMRGRSAFHRTRREYMEEHLGTTDEHELAKRGIERAP